MTPTAAALLNTLCLLGRVPLPTDKNKPARLERPALKPHQEEQAVPPMQVARAQKAARKADAPDSQAGRKRKLAPGQNMFIPGMRGDLGFSGTLGDPVSVL